MGLKQEGGKASNSLCFTGKMLTDLINHINKKAQYRKNTVLHTLPEKHRNNQQGLCSQSA